VGRNPRPRVAQRRLQIERIAAGYEVVGDVVEKIGPSLARIFPRRDISASKTRLMIQRSSRSHGRKQFDPD